MTTSSRAEDSSSPTILDDVDMVLPSLAQRGLYSEDLLESPDTVKVDTSLRSRFDSFLPQPHQHHESISTSNSESSESSPTTTASLDSSTTEMSPGTSPESPMAKGPMTVPLRPHVVEEPRLSPPSAHVFDMQRPQTPGKRARNLKNLAVNTGASLSAGRGASTAALPISENNGSVTAWRQPGLSFAKPQSPPKRKPASLALTIETPATGKPTARQIQIAIPPTPSFGRPPLRHFQSSPSLPMSSRSFFPRAVPTPAIPSVPVVQEPVQSPEEEQNFNVPQSKEDKPDAYPNGPICVYEPGLDLYLEPTADQARAYDVILNVASEVRNPFSALLLPVDAEPNLRIDGGGGIQYAPSRKSSHDVVDRTPLSPVRETSSPTTPKATPLRDQFSPDVKTSVPDPEYVHIPWEHNTDIVPDLLRLVKLIDDRVSSGKRVLVHCQCGVSRSATLIVAYCLYKHPETSVQEAYDTIKRRSKWIGPNMNLIMQLQEFRSTLTGGSRPAPTFKSLTPVEVSTSWNAWRGIDGEKSDRFSKAPNTAPLPQLNVKSLNLGSNHASGAVTPGPLSAPSNVTWSLSMQRPPEVDSKDRPAQDSQIPQPITLLKTQRLGSEGSIERPSPVKVDSHDPDSSAATVTRRMSTSTPRSEQFAMTALQPSKDVAPNDHFGLMSPSASEFPHSPLDRSALLGSLGMGPAIHAPLPSHKRKTDSPSSIQRGSSLRAPPMKEQKGNDRALRKPRSFQHLSPALSADQASTDGKSHSDALMSPRAFEFTQNPFEAALTPPTEGASGVGRVEMRDDDPRSPPLKGSSPITRNIADAL